MESELLRAIISLGFADLVLILPISRSRSYTGFRYSLNSSLVMTSFLRYATTS